VRRKGNVATGDVECFDPWQGVNDQTAHIANMWDYQWCTEQFMPNSRDGVHDIFWNDPWNETAARLGCQQEWGVEPRPLWADTEWGGKNLPSLTNVVFSNGLYDPWHGAGVLKSLGPTVKVRMHAAPEASKRCMPRVSTVGWPAGCDHSRWRTPSRPDVLKPQRPAHGDSSPAQRAERDQALDQGVPLHLTACTAAALVAADRRLPHNPLAVS
jgi:hypothetical protein